MLSLNWKSEGRECLIIGGGHVAVRKTKRLIKAGTSVTVIAAVSEDVIASLAEKGIIEYKNRQFYKGDEDGFDLVISAAGNKEIAEYLQKRAEEKCFLYNAADFPTYGNVHFPACIERKHLTVALSTEGKSPAFSRAVKEWLDREIPENFGEWADCMALLREEAKKRIATPTARELFWRTAFSEEVMAYVSQGNLKQAEELIRHAMDGFGTEP